MGRHNEKTSKRWYDGLPVSRWGEDDWEEMMYWDYVKDEEIDLMIENMFDEMMGGYGD